MDDKSGIWEAFWHYLGQLQHLGGQLRACKYQKRNDFAFLSKILRQKTECWYQVESVGIHTKFLLLRKPPKRLSHYHQKPLLIRNPQP